MSQALAAQLTDKQALFVHHLATGSKQGAAAQLAGFACPDQAATRLMRAPSVAAALRAELNRRVAMEGRPYAFNTLMALMEPAQPPATRLGAAKAMLEYEQKLAESLGLGKPIDELSEAELASLAAALRPHDTAGMVDVTPHVPRSDGASDSQVIDIIDDDGGKALP